MSKSSKDKQNGPISIPIPFDEAIRAALKVKPPEKPKRKRKPRAKKPAKP